MLEGDEFTTGVINTTLTLTQLAIYLVYLTLIIRMLSKAQL
jgi:hypothetical protein